MTNAGTIGAALLLSQALPADPVAVRHREGLVHGFLAARTLAGETLATGDLLQTSRGDVVTSRLVLHFKDDSLHDETTVFSQTGRFRLLSYRLTQKGPSFPRPLDFTLDGRSGQASVRHVDGDGETKVEDRRLEKVPPDLANGMVPTLLKNVRTDGGPMTFAMLAATPKPVMVTLVVTPTGEEPFTTSGATHRAQHFVIKVDIGGVTGMLASLLGKDPPDTHVWILTGAVPAFVKSEGALTSVVRSCGSSWPARVGRKPRPRHSAASGRAVLGRGPRPHPGALTGMRHFVQRGVAETCPPGLAGTAVGLSAPLGSGPQGEGAPSGWLVSCSFTEERPLPGRAWTRPQTSWRKQMDLASTNLIVTLIIGGVVGWLASILMKTNAQMGILANVIVGIFGSFIGVAVANAMGVRAHTAPTAWVVAILGAALLIALLRALGVFNRFASAR